MKFAATCLFGLERFVGEEIDSLGYERTETIDGRVYFTGDYSAIARCNLRLRCAERVYLVLGDFMAESFTQLFDGVTALPWEDVIGREDCFPVKGHSIGSSLFSIPDCQSIVKKAVVERLKRTYRCSWFQETGVKYQIVFFLLNNRATLMIDTSGTPLHKRGYRTDAGIAPIRETLACALVKIARPREQVRLWDPFCGSGTIPIEAALMMSGIAPGINRGFVSEEFGWIPKPIWKEERDMARAQQAPPGEYTSFGTDIDGNILEIAKENAKRAGVGKYIRFFEKDALKITKDDRRTTIVCNPPYGERMDSPARAAALYRKMGSLFRTFSPWQIYILCPDQRFETHYGMRADKVRTLYNGMIRCGYYQFFKRRAEDKRGE